ncbi:MAG: NAD(+) synthase [Acholeplasmatales bacterium]|nr:NAD(+) synthase [Acholeplasmatales bacterium]
MKNGFIKLANVTPRVYLGDVKENLNEIKKAIKKIDADIITFPELALTGYSLGDVFFQNDIINEVEESVEEFLKANSFEGVIILGAPVKVENSLYNCALVIQKDIILGIVPKTFLPNSGEFREKRWFKSDYDFDSICYANLEVPFGSIKFIDQLNKVNFAVEICYDMFAPISMSSIYSINGCNMIFNIAASDEVIGKDEMRRNFISAKSKECCAIYSYTSTGVTDSTSSVLFGGAKVVAQNGELLNNAELYKMDTDIMYTICDIDRINYARDKFIALNDSLGVVDAYIQDVYFSLPEKEYLPAIDKDPFIPKNNPKEAYKTISNILELALARRIEVSHSKTVVVGISGGLDSTLTLLVAYKAFKRLKMDVKNIIAITMPGLGTSERTKTNADVLMETLGVTRREISIEKSVLGHFRDINHKKDNMNITYENAQARMRTLILMDVANDNQGIVLGTGDMSEIALGWATYNGDQMSMYNTNCNIPKTLVRFMVKAYADYEFKNAKDTLYDIIDTPISPELKKDQKTEDTVGKYEINDFILYNYLMNGYSAEKIAYLLSKAYEIDGAEDVKKFFNRFYSQQFKREASPDGIRVFSESLDPRNGFVIPSDILRRLK